MNWKNRIIGLIAVIVVLGSGIYFLNKPARNEVPSRADSQTEQLTGEVSYQGAEGTTALALLKDKYTVETEQFSFGEMVVAIDGARAGNDEFWAFYVNGAPAQVGAGDYVTQSTDTIEWRLEKQ